MAELKWIKICTDIFDDEKMILIESLPKADSIIVIWFKLLCLAGKQNNSGVFMMNNKVAYTDEMLSTIFRRKLPIIRLALDTFEQFGMIERVEGVVTIPNWEKHQSLDQLEIAREQTRKRVAKHREKQKLLANEECNATVTLHVTQCNANRIEEDKIRLDKDKEKENILLKEKEEKFVKPTIQEISDYCKERKNNIDPERFFDHYEAVDWTIGRNHQKMKDWRCAVRYWERNDYSKKNNNNNSNDNKSQEINITKFDIK